MSEQNLPKDLVLPAQIMRELKISRQLMDQRMKSGAYPVYDYYGLKLISRADVKNYVPVVTGRPRKTHSENTH